MDVMEKLVELLNEMQDSGIVETPAGFSFTKQYIENDKVASHLFDNGTTVQEEAKLYWKPVKPGEWNLTCSACDSHLGCKENASYCPECGAKFVYPKAVMPQPPKGE